jgi:hypothetical protein
MHWFFSLLVNDMRWYKWTISCDQSLLQNNVVDNIIRWRLHT